MYDPRVTHPLSADQEVGIRRLRILLPEAANYYDPAASDPRDTCAACGDGECGGACPAAMGIVRQVIDALGCGEDDWLWWVEYFEREGDDDA